MDSGRDRMRMDDDRLSLLPDDVIIEILSFVGIKDAIRKTSVLSSRWRFMWTLIPHLTFSTQDFSTMDNFFDFVTNVMSRRNNQLQLSSFNLCFRRNDDGGVAQRIMNHAFSLNVQQLSVTCLFGEGYTFDSDNKTGFPLSLSDIPMFRHLQPILRGPGYIYTLPTPTHEFSSLATLHLCTVTLYDGFLSMCPNLENLTLYWCTMLGSKVFRICHPRLSNLTLTTMRTIGLVVHVVTPKLKYLTISEHMNVIEISAPELVSLRFEGPCPWMFTTGDFPCLEKAHLSMHNTLNRPSSYAPTVISLLQKFHNVKLLSLSMDIIEVLNASVELISHQPLLLAKLKSLKIVPCWGCKDKKVVMSAQLKNYLLNTTHNATLTEVLPG